MAKEIYRVGEIVKNPGMYRLGMVMAELNLPRRQLVNPNGVTVAFNPDQNHRQYLFDSNAYPIAPQLERQGSLYAHTILPDGRLILVTSTASPYTVEGDHINVWLPRGDNFMFQPTLAEVSDEQGQKGLGVVACIAAQYHEQNGAKNYYVGMNVQLSEFERQSVQSIRDAVHLHVVRMDDEDIRNLKPISKPSHRREFADSYTPFSLAIFGQVIATKVMDSPGAQEYISRSFTHGDYPLLYPQAHFFELRDGWNSVGHEGFFGFLRNLEAIITKQYGELINCFTNGNREIFRLQVGNGTSSTDFFRRLLPLPSDEIHARLDKYLERHLELTDDKALFFLRYMADNIQPASAILKANMEKIDEATGIPIVSSHTVNTKMIMEGESYNILFFPDPTGEKILMGIVPRVTSGGSPLDAFGLKKQQFVLPNPDDFNVLMDAADKRRDEIVHNLLVNIPYLSAGSAMKGKPLY